MRLFTSCAVKFFSVLSLCYLGACANPYNPLDDFTEVNPETAITAPEPDVSSLAPVPLEQVQRGQYLVELLGCGNCHTDGALLGDANYSRRLAGSSIGIAFTNPLENKYPGVVFPSNLTPDDATGIGTWEDIELMKMIRSGVDRHGRRKLSVMPWPAYSIISDDDALAIVSYLRHLPPVSHKVPESVKAGEKSANPYVHFGMYQSRH